MHLCLPSTKYCTCLLTSWEFIGAALNKLLLKKETIRLYWTWKTLTKVPILNFTAVGKILKIISVYTYKCMYILNYTYASYHRWRHFAEVFPLNDHYAKI